MISKISNLLIEIGHSILQLKLPVGNIDSNQLKSSWCSQCGHVIVYRDFFGLGTFIILPHILHWCLIVSGCLGFSGSVSVLPTSVDQPRESEYESFFLIFELLNESRIFLFFLRRLPGGVLDAMSVP